MAAPINSELRRAANLRSLQRVDPLIQDLGTTVSHVHLYEFSASKKIWEKNNIEGSLFVAKRSDAPVFKLIVLNRSSNENLEVPITSTFQMQMTGEYLIFRDGSATEHELVRGIWFHDGEERDNFVRYVENVVKAVGQMEEMSVKKEAKVEAENAGAALLASLNLGSRDENTKNEPARLQQQSQSKVEKPTPVQTAENGNLTLDKKSLQLALLSLIQDERFLDLIHAQYLKVANARNAREQQARRDSDK